MATLYIVKHTFKTGGNVFLMGSVISDPTEIRLFRSKVREGKIIEVKEQDLPHIAEYVESRTGVNPIEVFKELVSTKKAEAKKLADEAEAKKLADEAKKLAAEAEAKKLADEAEAKKLADEKKVTKVPIKAATVVIKG